MSNLNDYPTIDIMNHLREIRSDLATVPFEYREFQIMLRTTFKSLADESGRRKEVKEGEAGDTLAGHRSVAACLASMDEYGYEQVSVCATKMWSYYYHRDFILNSPVEPIGEAIRESGGRIMGAASYDPFRISESLREIEHVVREYGFNYVWFHPLSYGLPPNDRRFYPLYAKCVELDIAVGFQVGHSAEVLPSDCGRPMLADDVAIEFPDLRINLSHTGWPWVDEWCSMLWRHPNVYGDISGYFPKGLDDRLVKFMDSGRGRDKVLFGTNGLGLRRCKEEFLQLDIAESTKRKVLYDNARRFLALDRG
ncbi:amidohydrolase family protein [Aromatoleum toluclasticum]|uniref:amidohydrolase family protein n=1 Tax=Aromatoleum toluclasticum TaxID=92003 RepID=UPI00035CCB99|nr:amidohydrolase family protein [Aromatoleum toluclasticum]MCC4114850.1 amidohydrolase family protein [Aromatoleum toluclasticum]